MRGREEPPLSEGGSHWRVAEKGMRSITLGVSGIVGTSVCVANRTQPAFVMHVATHCTHNSPTTNRFTVTTAVPAVLFAVHVYIPLLLLTTGLMVRTDPLTPSVVRILFLLNV